MHVQNYTFLFIAFILCLNSGAQDKLPESFTSQEELQAAGFELLDTINIVVFGQEQSQIVAKSELERVSLDGSGQKRSEDDVILETLIFFDAQKHGLIDEASVDRYLQAIQQDNNLSLEQLKQVFENSGYLFEEARNYLGMMGSVRSMLDYKITSKLIVPEKKVRAYYEEHPVYQQAAYLIKHAEVPFTRANRSDVGKELADRISAGDSFDDLAWGDPFWIEHNDLADHLQFITDMKVGKIAKPIVQERHFDLFKLHDKRPQVQIPLEDRYQEIVKELQKPLYEKLFEEYKSELFRASSILRLKG